MRAVAAFFATDLSKPRPLAEGERRRLVSLATLVVRCRSAVERDGQTREVELIPEPEAPTRLIVVLERLLAGLDAIGVDRPMAWSVVTKAALDSIPALRRAVLQALHRAGAQLEKSRVAEAVSYPTQTTRRALEDPAAHRLVIRSPQGPRKGGPVVARRLGG